MDSSSPIRRCRGQALPLGIAFIMFVSLAILILYNSSQLVSKKSHIANAADAAAYSGVVWQARALNFQAYTNRAMVANQVSIAQFVSIASWTGYSAIAARNVNAAIGWIPPVAPFTNGAHQAAEQVDQVVGTVANVVVPIISGVNTILSAVQQAVYFSTFAITPSIVKEVAKANDSAYSVESNYSIASMGLNAVDWQAFTEQYNDDEISRKAGVINQSRDRFTRDRGWDVGRFYFGFAKFQLRKEGMTHLVQEDGKWAWKGKDTLSLHHWRFKCSLRRGCKWRHSELPIGWGSAYASNDLQCDTDCPRWEIHNGNSGRMADEESSSINGYGGVQAFYDLADLSKQNKDPRLVLRVEVQAPQSRMDTSTQKGFGSSEAVGAETRKNGFGSGMFRLDDKLAANSMASISSAEVYFERPTFDNNALIVDGDEKHEYGSLWNPYWQVRLTVTPKEQQFAAWAMRDSTLIAGAGGAVDGARSYARTQQEELTELFELKQYGEMAEEQLPQMLADQVEAVEELEELAALSEPLEGAAAAVAEQKQRVEQSIADSQNQLTLIGAELDGLEQQLGQAEDNFSREQILQEIDALETEQNQLTGYVNDAREQYSDLANQYDAQLADLEGLRSRGRELAAQVGALNSDISSAKDIHALITDVETLIGDTEGAIAGVDTELAKDFFSELSEAESLAASLSGGGLEALKDQLAEAGKQQIEDHIKDELTEKIKETLVEAIEGAAKAFFSDYAGDFDQFAQKAEERAAEAEAVLGQVSTDYIKPLEDQLAALRREQEQLREMFQQELDGALAEINSGIDFYRDAVTEEVSRVAESFESQIDPLIKQQLEAESEELEGEIAAKISNLEARRDREVASIEESYNQRISDLENRKQEIVDEFERNLGDLKNELNEEIASLEEQIASLKSKLNAG